MDPDEIIRYVVISVFVALVIYALTHPEVLLGEVREDGAPTGGDTDVGGDELARALPSGGLPQRLAEPRPKTASRSRLRDYLLGGLAIGAAGTIVWLIRDYIAEPDRVMVFLLAVGLVAFRVRLGPALATALLSVAAYDFFFVEPFFTFAVDDARYLLTFAAMAAVGAVLSSLTARLRLQTKRALDAEARTTELYRLTHELVGTDDPTDLAMTAASAIQRAFPGDVSVFLRDAGGSDVRVAQCGAPIEPLPRSAGASASDMIVRPRDAEGADELTLPLVGQAGVLGAVVVRGRGSGELGDAQARRLLGTFVGQIALALERTRLSVAHSEAERDAEAERLRSTLLASISHDLRTPLGSVLGSASTLLDSDANIEATVRRDLLRSIYDEAEGLARLLNNLLTMTRVEGGGVRVKAEWQVPEEVIGVAIARLRERRGDRELRVTIDPSIELVAFDGLLIELVLTNLLDNAIKYTPAGSPVEIRVRRGAAGTTFEVLDRGPGVAAEERGRVFDKLYRGRRTEGLPGAGLGLAIARAIVVSHGGTIEVGDREDGPGAVFSFTLPGSSDLPPGDDDLDEVQP